MRINTSNYNTLPNYNYDNKKQTNKIVFTSSNATMDRFIKLSSELKKKLLPQKHDEIIDNVTAQIESYLSKNLELEKVTNGFEDLNKYLQYSDIENFKNDQGIVIKFINGMKNLGVNEGFNRISGYLKIKEELTKNFINKSIIMSKTSQNTPVPNAVLFYGPNGNGKTVFAKALAEQSLSNYEIIDCGDKSADETYNLLLKKLEQAQEAFRKSQDKQTRTIIILNESETILNPKSSVFDKIKKILPSISEKYNSTLFLTSNFPEFIERSILKSDITPIKVAIEPANYETARELIHKTIASMTKELVDVDEITQYFFKDENYYSNGRIKNLITSVFKSTSKPTISDFRRAIIAQRPNITRLDLQNLKVQTDYLNNL